jgi:hypothetical protein
MKTLKGLRANARASEPADASPVEP